MTKYIQVITTSDNRSELENIARLSVEKQLAACVQISSAISSIYTWQGIIETADKCLMCATGEGKPIKPGSRKQ